ncbi:3-methyl-2-oxobutanoate hydroxymethyltransferase [Phanerochaete sordida]|uniref:3-methyl-2-oxobutanoate hydroxymethyltransferase n=1 Tax=Phanerochaete sordida TaxID=48140 RepID=A0A9P3GKS1_9APHY|nr:3-methyl-2-oxobutanoate hydroxymethyltransferase [Phanerochaete sordida]
MFRPVLASRVLRRNAARHLVAGTRRVSSVSEQATEDTAEAPVTSAAETEDKVLDATVPEGKPKIVAEVERAGGDKYIEWERTKITLAHLRTMKRYRTPISMLTAYDYPTGLACDASRVEIVLVGDSLAQVCLGYDSTTRITLDEMIHHCKAVARGCKTPFLVVDMPFGTYHGTPEETFHNAVRLVREGGAEAVKLEGGPEIAHHVEHLTLAGIPVFAHLGLMPQRAVQLGGYLPQARRFHSAKRLVEHALVMEQAGAVAVVLEAVPPEVAEAATSRLKHAFTIGIGAGRGTDGQVLVWDDMLGNSRGRKPRFVRQFAHLRKHVDDGIAAYVNAVRRRTYPAYQTSNMYSMDSDQSRQLFAEWMERTRRGLATENATTEGENEPSSDLESQTGMKARG